MSAPFSEPTLPTREAAETLAAELVAEMIARWANGDHVLPEDLLARRPELWQHPEAAADLIYEELCLRQEHGVEIPLEEVLTRFPQWRPQLEVLFDCQRLLGPRRTAPQFPAVGEVLGDFLLLRELGRGGLGRVFLAIQRSLGDRPVVLKLTPGEAREHLSLARLQHTHIVPLYSVQDDSARGLRALCMPYFGGTTLDRLLEALRQQPPARRTGQDLLEALDQLTRELPVAQENAPARQLLAGAAYVQAVCWIGICLADALQYAHERGVVHLDIKPSNVLLAADGTPMLLDFHLAREPIDPGDGPPQWVGGTVGYMSPEQRAAVAAVQRGRATPLPVDGRSDVYSLGLVLYEALGGDPPAGSDGVSSITHFEGGAGRSRQTLPPSPSAQPAPLHQVNREVSVGLADVIDKCLTENPRDRYPNMAALAADLRRHLANLPLAGVRNRSLRERWRKWRHRRPHGAVLTAMALAVVTAAAAVGLGAVTHFGQRLHEARASLQDGDALLAQGEWQGAARTFEHGREVARGLPFQGDLADTLDHRLRRAELERDAAERDAAVRSLHQLADRVRFLYGTSTLPPELRRGLEASCRTFWENRERIVRRLSPGGAALLEPAVREDLLDLALFWADLQLRLVPSGDRESARRQARTVLDQAEALFGQSPVLDAERTGNAPASGAARTAWEHGALGRLCLRSGDLQRAAAEFAEAVRLQPQGLWPNFYHGLCCYRQGAYEEAVMAYSVCIGAAPRAACFYNRALALDALGRTELAQRDYDEALRLDPALGAAALNRGMVHYRRKEYAAAVTDLRRAAELGVDPAVVSFDLALVHLACRELSAGLDDLCCAAGALLARW
jgi:serine/threonine protein kinase/Flp pilus assembly protein TadD